MKVSYNWLRELCPTGDDVGPAALAAALTAAGLEVEGQATLGGFSGVVVAEVRARRRHPQADKLALVDVFDGQAVTQVVCGAPNVPEAGGKVAWARPGARLPDGRVLAPREVRGVVSPGMLCAAAELGLEGGVDGLLLLDDDSAPGADVAALLGFPDTILELNVTPNRPDCMGHLGVAREVAALFSRGGRELAAVAPIADLLPFASDDGGPPDLVHIADPLGCARYQGRQLVGLRVAPSPLAVRLRLQALGVRAINNVVDATNLVLLETGHPLHAFDLHRLEGMRVVVRRAAPGEVLRTLDGQERRLAGEDLCVCDAERPVALAGVMGGEATEVGPATTAVLLESAWFDPASIRRTSRRLGLRTEASQRFERGADPNGQLALASARCARLIAQWARAPGVERIAGAGVVDAYPRRIAPAVVALRPARTALVLGLEVAAAEQLALLARLGTHPLTPPAPGAGRIEFVVPTFRPDLTREADLIEEVGRLVGLDRVPATLPPLRALSPERLDPRPERARDALSALGFSEAIGLSFGPADENLPLRALDGRDQPLRVENPLGEDRASLRLSLLPGLLRAAGKNLAHGVAEQRLFEVGTVFLPREGRTLAAREGWPAHGRDHELPEERARVGGILLGRRGGWLKDGEAYDFFDGRGVVEQLLGALGTGDARFARLPEGGADWLHPGRSAVIRCGGAAAGVVGEVHPDVLARLGGETRVDPGGVVLFEVDLGLLGPPSRPRMAEPSRFPSSSRDLSFFVDREAPAADLAAVMAAASPLVAAVRPLDDYREPGRVPAGQKGMLFSLEYRAPDRTLTDEEIASAHAAVWAALGARYALTPR